MKSSSIRYITYLPGLGPESLRPVKHLDRLPGWLPGGKTYLTPTGRSALYYGCKSMSLGKGSQILVPSFVCNTVSAPLAVAGAQPVFFRIKRDFTIDWDHVAALLSPRVKAMLWYHYLGLSFGFDEVVPFCRRHGLYLIEDCAHALFRLYQGKPVGGLGDYSVFGIRKSIPATLLGALVVNNPRFHVRGFTADAAPSPAQAAYALERENYLYRVYLQTLDPTRRVEQPLYRYHANRLAQCYRADDVRTHRLDEVSRLVMHNADPVGVRTRRHRNYRICLKNLKAVCPFPTITAGAAPLGFPLLHPDRERFWKRMLGRGIETVAFWEQGALPAGVAKRFPDTAWLARNNVCLPCHQDLTEVDMEYVCRSVKACW